MPVSLVKGEPYYLEINEDDINDVVHSCFIYL
jgi:hypothetical protein